MSKIVGIDLGTTNSLVAIVENGVPTVISSPDGKRLVPSVIYFDPGGNVVVGDRTKEHTIFSIKRFMGKGIDDVREDLPLLPFNVSSDSEHIIRIKIHGRDYTPPELSAFILRELKRKAEAALGETSRLFHESVSWRYRRPEWNAMVQGMFAQAQAAVLQAKGRYAEAEPFWRQAAAALAADAKYSNDWWLDLLYSWLAWNLTRQGRLVEAEIEARRALLGALRHGRPLAPRGRPPRLRCGVDGEPACRRRRRRDRCRGS